MENRECVDKVGNSFSRKTLYHGINYEFNKLTRFGTNKEKQFLEK
jgi:hypothetical protein